MCMTTVNPLGQDYQIRQNQNLRLLSDYHLDEDEAVLFKLIFHLTNTVGNGKLKAPSLGSSVTATIQ